MTALTPRLNAYASGSYARALGVVRDKSALHAITELARVYGLTVAIFVALSGSTTPFGKNRVFDTTRRE